ncbi:hypothetical protein FGO68_gene13623 [Halteria grandinella]|uniref:Uncharacterized protein n=1 Tax=Halteria grandinella TaxID=5974 RepID=A0A8J8NMJ3_HALGN|nr:hypothetical protein FGO68_gene13623 [Halteria grandinella]
MSSIRNIIFITIRPIYTPLLVTTTTTFFNLISNKFMAHIHTYTQAVPTRLLQYPQTSIALRTAPLWGPLNVPIANAQLGDSQCERPSSLYSLSLLISLYKVLGDTHVGAPKSNLTSSAAPTVPTRAASAQQLESFPLYSVFLSQYYLNLHCGGAPSSGRKTSLTEREDNSGKTEVVLKSRESSLTSSQATQGRAETPQLSTSSPWCANHVNHEHPSRETASSRIQSKQRFGQKRFLVRVRTRADLKGLVPTRTCELDQRQRRHQESGRFRPPLIHPRSA